MKNKVIDKLRGGLIVSCQAPANSPLCRPEIIAALALTAELNGAAGVRINSPAHIAATNQTVAVPLIGISKVESAESNVYITPTFAAAAEVAAAGSDIIALDATPRPRPNGEKLENLIKRVQAELNLPVLADIATFDEGLAAADYGADLVATTLCSYTAETKGQTAPAFELLARLTRRLNVPVICEGGIGSPADVRQAFECGAFAVVVGTAITGVDRLVRTFVAATRQD